MPWLHALLDVPDHLHDTVADFWSGVLGWPLSEPWPGHPELRSFAPPAGAAYVHLQRVDRVDDAPRVHLDLEAADLPGTVDRAVALGATTVAEHEEWRTLRSPGGLLFCLFPAATRDLPDPVTWPGGHRARMVQVSIDSPAPRCDAEVAFWLGLLGERLVGSGSPEFAGTWHDDAGSPLQLLFQRLDETEGPVRAHLDHGTDDRAAEVRRLLALGAEDVGEGRGWHVLRDPAGMLFCVTDNSPESTTSRRLG